MNMGSLGSLLGIRIVESPHMRYDEMHWTPDVIEVGEYGHLRHVLALGALYAAMRADTRSALASFAAPVGGTTE